MATRKTSRMRESVLALILLALVGCVGASDDSHAAGIAWVKNYADGLRLAKESGKPAMLLFTAEWCAPCRDLKKYVFSDSRVVDASKGLIAIYIDVDADRETLAAYKVRAIPAVIFLDPSGGFVATYSGDRSVRSFVNQMTAIAQKYTQGGRHDG
jgi:thiol:disulfide interchange protein